MFPPADGKGLVFNVMRFSLHDGPGIRTTVFLKGCPLSCRWCHNPESRAAARQLMYAAERCVRCGRCVAACPHGALRWEDGPVRDAKLCEQCGACVNSCMADARQLAGQWMTVEEVLRQVRRDIIFYDESGGGVTFSGGEPLMQPEFLEGVLCACRAEGIHTAVDTCGYVQPAILARVSGKVDLFLYDLKLIDGARHKQFTGAPNGLILENLALLLGEGKPVIVRIPIVPGINDDEENISGTMEFLSRKGVRRVELLAYHETGTGKYQRLQLPYPLKDIRPPSPEHMQQLSNRFSRQGFAVRIGG